MPGNSHPKQGKIQSLDTTLPLKHILPVLLAAAPCLTQGFGAGAAAAIGKRGEAVELTRTLPLQCFYL